MSATTQTRSYRAQKAALTRAEKQGPRAVIIEVERAWAEFAAFGWPDNWSRWQRAGDDARLELRRTHGWTL